MNDDLLWLQNWYYSNCNNVWEHQHGVRIDTIDNPGWSIELDLTGTNYATLSIERIEDEWEGGWCHIWVENARLCAACGPLNLDHVIIQFRALLN